MTCLSKLSGETLTPNVQKPQCFRLDFSSAIAELENDPGKVFSTKHPQWIDYRLREGSRFAPGSLPWENKTTGLRRPKRVSR